MIANLKKNPISFPDGGSKMGYLIFLFALAMKGGIWYGCLILQIRISKYSTEKAGWKTFGNFLLLTFGPIAAMALSLFLSMQVTNESEYTRKGVGWLYVIFFMFQIIGIPAKAILLPVMHVVIRKKEMKNNGTGKPETDLRF
jgi:hypothetical protein